VTVFVSTGTTGFDNLAEAMDRLANELREPVVIQIGQGKYVPRNAAYFRLAPSLAPYIQQASLVVAHGGLGTCTEVLELGRRLVAVSNPDRYDNHQEDLLVSLEAAGHLIYCRRLDELPSAIKRALGTVFRPYPRPETTIHIRIKEYLSQLALRRFKESRS
jgi:beta-1,4-N-acetylglucosaminyltransferase